MGLSTVLLQRIALWMLMWIPILAVATDDVTAELDRSTKLAPVRVAIDLWPGYYPVVIGKRQGFFERRGLAVDVVVPEDTDQMLRSFAAGELDVVCVALGDVFAFREKVPSLKVVLISDESSGGDALLSLKPLPESFKGLKIGTNLNGFGELFVRAFLSQNKVNIADVELVNQEASDAGTLLREGKVDIAHTWEPYVSVLTAYQDASVVFSSAQTPGLIPDAVVMHGRMLQNERVARAFVAGWLEAAEWWLGHRHEGNRIAEQALVMMPNTVNLEGIRLFDTRANRRAFTRTNAHYSLFQVTQTYIDYFKEKGILKAVVKPEDIVTGALLPGSSVVFVPVPHPPQ